MSLCCVDNFSAYRTAQLSKASNWFMLIAPPMLLYFSLFKYVRVTFWALGPIVKPLSPGKKVHLAIFGAFWVWQMCQIDHPECPQCCSILVPTCSAKSYGIKVCLAYFVIFGHTLAYFSHFWSQSAIFLTIFTGEKRPNIVWLDAPDVFQPCSTRPTQNMPTRLICVVKRLFSSCLGHLLALFGSYLRHSWFGKWAKLVSLNVLSAGTTLFQPASQKCMVLRPTFSFLSYVCLLRPLIGHFWSQIDKYCTILT